MSETPVTFRASSYGGDNAHEAVALVAGFGGSTSDLVRAAVTLAYSGRDVVVYAPGPELLLSGDPSLLPDYATMAAQDFRERADSYPVRRYGGFSLGGGIAANMQKLDPEAAAGLYAATGVDAAQLVMSNRLFRAMVLAHYKVDTRRLYERHGYPLPRLEQAWQTFQEPPNTFTLAVGALDYIVRQRDIRRKLAAWRSAYAFRLIRVPGLGHNGMKQWFNANILSMLDR